MYVPRQLERVVASRTASYPVIMLTGARQTGKTTLLRHLSEPARRFVSLDDLELRRFAQTEPRLFIEQLKPPVLIDEFQYAPAILSYIKIAVDELTTRGRNREAAGMYWLTGSQRFGLMEGVQESLAGRVALLDLLGFSPYELLRPTRFPVEGIFGQDLKALASDELLASSRQDAVGVFEAILRGSLPTSALALSGAEERRAFYSSYLQTYLERDVATFEGVRNIAAFELFMRLLAARTGQLVNFSALSREVGVSVNTIKAWTTTLERSFHILLLGPYYRSLGKRLVKTPKVYFLDSGLLAYLTGWSDPEQAARGPLAGPLFENWVVSNVVRSYRHRGMRESLYFWRTRTGQQIDLWAEEAGAINVAEVKLTSRLDAGTFRLLEDLDPSPLRFDKRIVFSLAKDVVEHAPWAWSVPTRFIN